jgi:hypothetical protein
MHTDPFEARRRGLHRLRVVTASLGAAAVVGTGALTWTLAGSTDAADAATTAGSGSGTSAGTSTTGNGQLSPPMQLPGSGGQGNAHASSGGS